MIVILTFRIILLIYVHELPRGHRPSCCLTVLTALMLRTKSAVDNRHTEAVSCKRAVSSTLNACTDITTHLLIDELPPLTAIAASCFNEAAAQFLPKGVTLCWIDGL